MKLLNLPVLDSKTDVTINVDQVVMLRPAEKYGREVTELHLSNDSVFFVDWPHNQMVEALHR